MGILSFCPAAFSDIRSQKEFMYTELLENRVLKRRLENIKGLSLQTELSPRFLSVPEFILHSFSWFINRDALNKFFYYPVDLIRFVCI